YRACEVGVRTRPVPLRHEAKPKLGEVTAIAPHAISPMRDVPASIERPEYVGKLAPEPYEGSNVQDADTIERMRKASLLAAQTLDAVEAAIAPGVTTDELDRVGHEFMVEHGAYPSTLGYRGFPK